MARKGQAMRRLEAENGIDLFTARRLSRVRRQLRRIDAMLMHETDPAKLDRLAAASMRLSDQEFALANRPKPGQRRPGPEQPRGAISPDLPG